MFVALSTNDFDVMMSISRWPAPETALVEARPEASVFGGGKPLVVMKYHHASS